MQVSFYKFLLILFLLTDITMQAQENYDITYEDASYKFGLHASPNGYGMFFRDAVPVNKNISRVWDFGLSSIKSIREKQVLNQRTVNTSPYIYGKVNRFYAFRPMFGFQNMYADKQNRNSVGVNVFALAGPTLGLLKPVYVITETFDPNSPGTIISSSVRYNPELQPHNKIIRYAPFGKGISETKPVPGISIKTGVEFNWGYYSTDYKSLEVGILLDYFPGRPQIMHFIKNKIVYSSFYLSFAFGKNY